MAGTDYRVEARAVWERGVRSDVAMQAEIEAAIRAAEERGRRRGVEEMQLGTCRVYRHGCADGRAIESHMSDRWREYALPHPKRDNCVEWVALAPRDSAPDSITPYALPRDSGREG